MRGIWRRNRALEEVRGGRREVSSSRFPSQRTRETLTVEKRTQGSDPSRLDRRKSLRSLMKEDSSKRDHGRFGEKGGRKERSNELTLFLLPPFAPNDDLLPNRRLSLLFGNQPWLPPQQSLMLAVSPTLSESVKKSLSPSWIQRWTSTVSFVLFCSSPFASSVRNKFQATDIGLCAFERFR